LTVATKMSNLVTVAQSQKFAVLVGGDVCNTRFSRTENRLKTAFADVDLSVVHRMSGQLQLCTAMILREKLENKHVVSTRRRTK